LHLPERSERLPLDMSAQEFNREAGRLPVHWRLLLRLLRPVLWIMTATASGRDRVWDSFSKKSYVGRLRDREGPLWDLIKTKRDREMSRCLREFVQDTARLKAGGDVAVIAGAGHMPALYATLRQCGFEKAGVRWFEVLDGLTIPSRGASGRARQTVV
jgi:hypothetical protein